MRLSSQRGGLGENIRVQMGCGGPRPGGVHITGTPKPLGALRKMYLTAEDAFMAYRYPNCWYICSIVRAPYLHIENDLKNLKRVLEMKNQQIGWQEKMIMELETNVSCHFPSRGGITEVIK